jgi:urea transporter
MYFLFSVGWLLVLIVLAMVVALVYMAVTKKDLRVAYKVLMYFIASLLLIWSLVAIGYKMYFFGLRVLTEPIKYTMPVVEEHFDTSKVPVFEPREKETLHLKIESLLLERKK